MATRIRALAQSMVAYFSMEIGLDPAIPTYSGGLGVLAGDTLRAAADIGMPLAGITLIYRKGYFRQHLDAHGNQTESPVIWSPEQVLEPLEPRIYVVVESRRVQVRAWRYILKGISGQTVPVYFLDTALPENSAWDQDLTDYLYGGDSRYRLCQEVVLGMGGIYMLRALGYDKVQAYHMNEGHSSLLTLALLEERLKGRSLGRIMEADMDAVREQCVFTTHTPVPAGHDQFPLEMAQKILGEERSRALHDSGCCWNGYLNMTRLGLLLSRYINGVSMRHEEISSTMFPNYPINSITNGVHVSTWTSPPFSRLYDRHIPEWRHDNLYLRYAMNIPTSEIRQAHAEAKREMLAQVKQRAGISLDSNVMTLGFARRATTYKRADLLFYDLDRLKRIVQTAGPLQVVYAGKAHPQDAGGKAVIRQVFEAAAALKDTIPVVYLEEYDMWLSRYLCSGVDVWMNTPQKPQEASGTSGMKAALNGVPSLSVLDGWWVEGHVEGVTGWSIGDSTDSENNPYTESISLYDKLEQLILPLYYQRPAAFGETMRSAISLNGSYYNAQRMMVQYVENAYLTAKDTTRT